MEVDIGFFFCFWVEVAKILVGLEGLYVKIRCFQERHSGK